MSPAPQGFGNSGREFSDPWGSKENPRKQALGTPVRPMVAKISLVTGINSWLAAKGMPQKGIHSTTCVSSPIGGDREVQVWEDGTFQKSVAGSRQRFG